MSHRNGLGLVIRHDDVEKLTSVARRERAPVYLIGEVTGDHQFTFFNPLSGERPIDLQLTDFFGNPPRTVMYASVVANPDSSLQYDPGAPSRYLDAGTSA
jgi:phosphoribosylformylglycinamidine synthase